MNRRDVWCDNPNCRPASKKKTRETPGFGAFDFRLLLPSARRPPPFPLISSSCRSHLQTRQKPPQTSGRTPLTEPKSSFLFFPDLLHPTARQAVHSSPHTKTKPPHSPHRPKSSTQQLHNAGPPSIRPPVAAVKTTATTALPSLEIQ
jgi:hypothetical protein